MNKLHKLCLALASTAVLGAANAATVITFDAGDPIGGLAAGTVLSNQYAAFGVTFAPNYFSGTNSPSGFWATNTDMTIVSSTGTAVGSLGTPSLVSGNVLHSFDNYLNENGDASFGVLFSGAGASSFSASFAGVSDPTKVQLYAYHGSTLIGSVQGTNVGQFTLSFNSPGTTITSVAITPGYYDDWVAVDNITFTAAVPEPGTAAMAAAGLLVMGGLWRRRRDA